MIDPRATATTTAFFEAILAALYAHDWPSPIATIGFREPFDELSTSLTIKTPALLLSVDAIAGLEDGDLTLDQGLCLPGRAAREMQCEIYCVLSTQTPGLPMQSIALSQAVFGLIESLESATTGRRGHDWGLGDAVEMPRQIRDTAMALGLHGAEVRVVSWSQVLYVPQQVRT